MTRPHRIREVTIDRISNAGNPVAKEQYNGEPILVFGAEPGDRVTVTLQPASSFVVGEIVNPTKEQEEHANRQKEARQKRLNATRKKPIKRSRKKRRRKRTRATKSLQDLGKRLGGTSTLKQDADATRSRWGGYGRRQDGRDKRRDVAHKYD